MKKTRLNALNKTLHFHPQDTLMDKNYNRDDCIKRELFAACWLQRNHYLLNCAANLEHHH